MQTKIKKLSIAHNRLLDEAVKTYADGQFVSVAASVEGDLWQTFVLARAFSSADLRSELWRQKYENWDTNSPPH